MLLLIFFLCRFFTVITVVIMDGANSEHSACESEIPGQIALMPEELGYESIVLENPVHERFCWEFVLREDNGTRAYKAVKPRVKDSTARVEASKLLTNPDIRSRIQQIKQELKRKYSATADDVLQYHGRVLKMDRMEYVDVKGTGKKKSIELKDIDRVDLVAASILDLEVNAVDKDSGKAVPSYSVPKRGDAAASLAKILGMNKDKTEITGPDGGPLRFADVSDEDLDSRIAFFLGKADAKEGAE